MAASVVNQASDQVNTTLQNTMSILDELSKIQKNEKLVFSWDAKGVWRESDSSAGRTLKAFGNGIKWICLMNYYSRDMSLLPRLINTQVVVALDQSSLEKDKVATLIEKVTAAISGLELLKSAYCEGDIHRSKIDASITMLTLAKSKLAAPDQVNSGSPVNPTDSNNSSWFGFGWFYYLVGRKV